MKKIFIVLFFLAKQVSATNIINVLNDTTINGTWNLSGAILKISAKISGNVTISHALIQASPYIQIFDTTVTIDPSCQIEEFSVIWYGASPNNTDNYVQLEKSILLSVNNWPLYIPKGIYKYSQKLFAYNLYQGNYSACFVNIRGDGDMWNFSTELWYTGVGGYAFGIQVAKGGSIHNIMFEGNFKSPKLDPANQLPYYSLTESQFNDTLGVQPAYNHWGIVIDPDASKNQSGSTNFKVYETFVDGFDICYNVSPNGYTYNAENLIFTNIRVGNSRIGYESGQAQEKDNIINNIVAWGNTYTLFSVGVSGKFQGSDTKVHGGNIANGVIRIVNCQEAQWYAFDIDNLFCESIGSVGTIYGTQPMSIRNCRFNFAAVLDGTGKNLLSTNSSTTVFENCTFSFFGTTHTIPISGACTMLNCNGAFNNSSPTGYSIVNYPLYTVPPPVTPAAYNLKVFIK